MSETLKATRAMQNAAEKRRLTDVLAALRSKAEADPGGGLMRRVGDAEGVLQKGDLFGTRTRIQEMATWVADRADQQNVAVSLATTVHLATARKETIEPSATGFQILNRDGMAWLTKKGRLVGSAKSAAERYRDTFEAAHGSLASALGEPERGRKVFQGFVPSEARHTAIWDLDEARKEALGSDQGLITLMDEVAGRGTTLRDLAKGDKHQADRLETEFLVACRLLARFYGSSSRRRA